MQEGGGYPAQQNAPSDIVCFAPFALDGATSATVQVAYGTLLSNTYSIPVVPQNIDVYAVLNPDGTLNSQTNPAPVNSVVGLFLTGAGQTVPASTDGALNTTPAIAPRTVPPVVVNGILEQPAFLGAAVGEVAGVMQLNLFVPDPGPLPNDAITIASTQVRIWTHP